MKNGKEISDPDCVMCKRNFASNSGLDKHINANHESMKYPLLDETFASKVELVNHSKMPSWVSNVETKAAPPTT